MSEQTQKRVFAFFDGQNLFNSAKSAFGYHYPNYDPIALAGLVCNTQANWHLCKIHFYTGIPRQGMDEPRYNFWTAKLAAMRNTANVQTFSRPLVYRDAKGQEKGIDVRLALDVVRLARERVYDVALIFSQDQDFSEVAVEVRNIAAEQERWVKIACAFPVGDNYPNKRGINGTDWIRLDKAFYDRAIDPTDYRSRKKS